MLKSSSYKELEVKLAQLSEMFEKKQVELDKKERQVQHLSKNIRKWSRKYHELEVSITENIIDHDEVDASPEQDIEVKKLKKLVLKLSGKNADLEKELDQIQALIGESSIDDEGLKKH